MHFFEGLLFGIGTILLIGPVLFVLLRASIKDGSKAGISVAIGIIISDIIYTIVCYKSLDYFFESDIVNTSINILGFIILLITGLFYLFKKENIEQNNNQISGKDYFKYLIKGFSINFFNPFVLGIWVYFSNYGKQKYDDAVIYYLLGILFGILITDLSKVYFSKYINRFVNSKKLLLFYKFSGIIMILFSIRILIYAIKP